MFIILQIQKSFLHIIDYQSILVFSFVNFAYLFAIVNSLLICAIAKAEVTAQCILRTGRKERT
jgi:hypothetical protein